MLIKHENKTKTFLSHRNEHNIILLLLKSRLETGKACKVFKQPTRLQYIQTNWISTKVFNLCDVRSK